MHDRALVIDVAKVAFANARIVGVVTHILNLFLLESLGLLALALQAE